MPVRIKSFTSALNIRHRVLCRVRLFHQHDGLIYTLYLCMYNNLTSRIWADDKLRLCKCYIPRLWPREKLSFKTGPTENMFLYPVIDSASVSTHPSESHTLISGRPKNPSYTPARSTSPGQQPILSLSAIGQHLIHLLWKAGTDPLQKDPHLRMHVFWNIITPCVLIPVQKLGLIVKSVYERFDEQIMIDQNRSY